jgi:hypothetical protein
MTTKTILDTTVYGEASGNYDGSSQDWSVILSLPPITIADAVVCRLLRLQ